MRQEGKARTQYEYGVKVRVAIELNEVSGDGHGFIPGCPITATRAPTHWSG